MSSEVQLIQLSGSPTQLLLYDDGIWRDITPPATATTPQDVAAIKNHLSRVMTDLNANPASVNPAALGFRAPFVQLYRELIPTEVDRLLVRVANAAPPGEPPRLKIFGRGADWIPWELLHDGTGFLGTRFVVARLPIMPHNTGVPGDKVRPVSSVHNLLGQQALPDPLLAAWKSTFDAVPAGVQRTYPDENGANYPTLQELDSARQADVLHVTCHGRVRDDDKSYYWTLHGGSPDRLRYHVNNGTAKNAGLTNRPLVFGNACVPAVAGEDLDLAEIVNGFGASFMIGGALNFIGTLAPITNSVAIAFARRFYEHLFGSNGTGPITVGEALLATKRSFAHENLHDPSYLFYCLYGPPDVTYKLTPPANVT